MAQHQPEETREVEIQFSCFYLGDTLCGLDIDLVQEINDELTITQVPLAPEYVLGIMNLRGQIITVIDQRLKIGLSPAKITRKHRVIIIKSQGEHLGLLVDRIAEVVTCYKRDIVKPPSNVNGLQGRLFKGVVQTREMGLLALLDIEAILDEDTVS